MGSGLELIDSLLQNSPTARPEQVHADTQGQSFPVIGLTHLLGIDLLVGRAVRTAVLLRCLSDPALREQIQRATNKAEAYNGFTKGLHFRQRRLADQPRPATAGQSSEVPRPRRRERDPLDHHRHDPDPAADGP
ncbi:Tn3 family transposase [Streptomyces sp. NPDC004752]